MSSPDPTTLPLLAAKAGFFPQPRRPPGYRIENDPRSCSIPEEGAAWPAPGPTRWAMFGIARSSRS